MADRVGRERWEEAQRWEREHWVRRERYLLRTRGLLARALEATGLRRRRVGDDWNRWWRDRFDNYAALPATIENAVELGCGPYTNVRLVLESRRIEHLYGSDPLARDYLRLSTGWLAGAVRSGQLMLDDHPAEECPYASDYFDLVVLINVLDHVRDADGCLAQAVRITRPGGLLLIGQDLTNAEDTARLPTSDVGHPIRVDHDWLDQRLLPLFLPRLHRVLPREHGRNTEAHYGTYLFIGEKRPAAD